MWSFADLLGYCTTTIACKELVNDGAGAFANAADDQSGPMPQATSNAAAPCTAPSIPNAADIKASGTAPAPALPLLKKGSSETLETTSVTSSLDDCFAQLHLPSKGSSDTLESTSVASTQGDCIAQHALDNFSDEEEKCPVVVDIALIEASDEDFHGSPDDACLKVPKHRQVAKAKSHGHKWCCRAQSLRELNIPVQQLLAPLGNNRHALSRFWEMLMREERMSKDWVVMYHSYTSSALIYEVQAAIAKVLFRFGAEFGSLPRLLKAPFASLPDARAVIKAFPSWGAERDCCDEFKQVGICCSTSLVSKDPEATPTEVFLEGYAASEVTIAVVEKLLKDCGAGTWNFLGGSTVKTLAAEILSAALRHELPQAMPSSSQRLGGHLLQIFVHKDHVDKWAYAAHPYGHPDGKRRPLSKCLSGRGPIKGQTRLIVNPSAFMRASAARLYVCSADQHFHANRKAFQQELSMLLSPILGTPQARERAARGVYAGELPSWWTDLG